MARLSAQHPHPSTPCHLAAKEFRQLVSTPLLTIDKVGCLPSDIEAASLSFQPVSSRNQRGSVVAAAMIDRLGHHAEVVNLKGESYRR